MKHKFAIFSLITTAFITGCANKIPTVSEPTQTATTQTATTQEDLKAKAKRLTDAQSKIPAPPSKTAYVDYGMISSGSEVYQWLLIKDSVRKVNHRSVSARIIANYPEPKSEKGKPYQSAILELQLDCENHKLFKILSVEYFTKFYAKGSMVSRSDYQEQGISKWMTTGSESPGARISRSACHVLSKQTDTSKANDEFLEMLKSEENFLNELKRDLPNPAPTTRSKIGAKIRSNMPKNIKFEGNQVGTFKIFQSPNGEVTDVKVVKSTGNEKLDNIAIEAIRKSSPLPIPTDKPADPFVITNIRFNND